MAVPSRGSAILPGIARREEKADDGRMRMHALAGGALEFHINQSSSFEAA
jgi:hypothetical protein